MSVDSVIPLEIIQREVSLIRYKKETETVTFQGKEITLENCTPILTPEQEAVIRRDLAQQLYEIFRKYMGKRQQEEIRK